MMGKKQSCVDHLGKHYQSLTAMCRHYGVSVPYYKARINKGMSVEEALTISDRAIKRRNNLAKSRGYKDMDTFDTGVYRKQYYKNHEL